MIENSLKQNIIFSLIYWHFFEVPKNILKIWKNFLKFGLNYFSIIILLKTFFSPWRQYKWSYGRGLDIPRFFETLFSNLISRFLGATVRSVIIIIGLLFEVFILIFGILFFLGWVFLPVILILGLYYGFQLLF